MNKKSVSLAWLLWVALGALPLRGATPAALYVSPSGDDANPGTSPNRPFKTLERARDAIRRGNYNQNMQADFFVYLRGGRYELDQTLTFDSRDSGSGGHSVVYAGYEKEEPVLCGGRRVIGWKAVGGKPYFVAAAPGPIATTGAATGAENTAPYFPQLYVNGVRAERARSNDFRISSRKTWWNEPGAPPFTKGTNSDYAQIPGSGVYVKKSEVKNYTNPEDIRLQWLEVFKIVDVPLAAFAPAEDNPDEMVFKIGPSFVGPTRWNALTTQKGFFIVNALEELDEPGEWYLDQKKHLVYYYPMLRDGDLNQAEVYAPCIQCLMKLDGTLEKPVHHLRFDGITFQHGNWTGAKSRLLGFSQAEIDSGYGSCIPGQIVLNFSNDVAVTRCTVRHMGSCGIQLDEGCNRVRLEGNLTYDTTAAGIMVGRIKDVGYPAANICTDTLIRNNVVRDTGRDYGQATGISLLSVYQCKVYHNDVSDTAYTAIHARTGGKTTAFNPGIGKLEYKWNKVSNCFANSRLGITDGGEIYMHGPYPGSEVSGNYSLHTNGSVNDEYYSDNFSHTGRWTGNVSRDSHAERPYFAWHSANIGVLFDDNYSDKANPTVGAGGKQTNFHLVKDNQWPPEAQRIMANAGLEPQYQYLLKKIYGHDNLAEGKKCVSSSNLDEAHGAAQAADNNWKSFWQTDDKATDAGWWEVDLGKPYVIQKVAILPRQDKYEVSARKNLEIQGSNDPTFKKHVVLAERGELPWYNKKAAPKAGASNLWEQFVNVRQGYRYLRVQSTKPGEALSMGEFLAYGYAVE